MTETKATTTGAVTSTPCEAKWLRVSAACVLIPSRWYRLRSKAPTIPPAPKHTATAAISVSTLRVNRMSKKPCRCSQNSIMR